MFQAFKELLPSDNNNEWSDIKPNTELKSGIEKFVNWYKDYYEC